MVLFFAPSPAVANHGGLNAPWSISPAAPVVSSPGSSRAERVGMRGCPLDEKIGASFCEWCLSIYQRDLSVGIHSECRMEPSCSNYSMDAVRKHGWLMGLLLTMDRFLRERDAPKHAPLIYTADRGFCYEDPVEDNDWWWKDREPAR